MNDVSGNGAFSENLKKDKMRRLSSVNRVSSTKEEGEMGGTGSDGKDENRSSAKVSKRFKHPRKIFRDCNSVNHASVPRKLRSVMKKRNRESISPPLPDKKKPNYAINEVELPGKEHNKKSIMNQRQNLEGSPTHPNVAPITKDEEEVVETLFALAEMFPNNNKKNGLESELTQSKSFRLAEGESSRPAFEAPGKEEESNSVCPSTIPEVFGPLEKSTEAIVKVKYSSELSQPGLTDSRQLHREGDTSSSQTNIQAKSLILTSQPVDSKPFCMSVSCNFESKLGMTTKCSNQLTHKEAAACASKPEIADGIAATLGCQDERQHTLEKSKKSDSGLWPGLSSATSGGAGTPGISTHLPNSNIPAWMGLIASSTRPSSEDNGALMDKDSRDPILKKKSWKKCPAHVHISHLIKALQTAEKTVVLPMPPTQLILNGPKQDTWVNKTVSENSIDGSAAGKTSNEIRNAILLHKRLVQDHQQASSMSTAYTPNKQNYDFLSLSTGGGELEAVKAVNKAGNLVEPWTQFHIPYLQSIAQNHTIMPLSLPQSHYSTSPFTNHLPVSAAKQVHMLPPSYQSSQILDPPQLGNASLPVPVRQQQQIWAAQFASQYKPVGLLSSQVPNWQNGKQDHPPSIQCSQYLPPPSHSSLELLRPMYVPNPQQGQNPIPPSSRGKRPHHNHHPSGYDSNPNIALPLRLLCYEHI